MATSSASEARPGKAGEHYHVDVFDDAGTFVRGLTVVPREGAAKWEVWDDFGLLGKSEHRVGTEASLPEAIRRALALLRAHLAVPIVPAWGGAPFEALGYRRPPSPFRWLSIGPFRLPWLRLRLPPHPAQWVGADGWPESGLEKSSS